MPAIVPDNPVSEYAPYVFSTAPVVLPDFKSFNALYANPLAAPKDSTLPTIASFRETFLKYFP